MIAAPFERSLVTYHDRPYHTMSKLRTAVWDVDSAAFPADASVEAQARFLLRYAILAPSSHNSQPWAFTVDGERIDVRVDESRWLEVADADRRELYVSVGCAVENLLIAAERFDFGYTLEYHADDDRVATVTLDPDGEPSSARPDGVFEAITKRRTSHEAFEDRPIERFTLERLRDAVLESGVELTFVADPDLKAAIGTLQAEADERQMAARAYREELGRWIGSGALGDSWPKTRIGQLAVTCLDLGEREGTKNAARIRNAPVVAVLSTRTDDRRARVETGRVFERLALIATVEGIATHPMSQILEVADLKRELAEVIGTSGTPQHLFRLGYTDGEAEHTPRWPLEDVLSR